MTATRGRWFLLGTLLVMALPTMTEAQKYDFLLTPHISSTPTFADEFDHTLGELLINTFAPTNHGSNDETKWMGSNTFIIAEDTQFGTGKVATRSGVRGDYNGSGQTEQSDLDLVLLNWGKPHSQIPATWINQVPKPGGDPPPGPIVDQSELDSVLLNWGAGDGKTIACLPWEIDPNVDSFYSVQAQVWMPEKSSNPNVANSVAVGFMDNTNLSQTSFEDGRGALWLELYYADSKAEGAHDAHYRVKAKDDTGTVELYDSADDDKTVDLSSGFATLEVAWKTSSLLNWRMFGAAVVDALGNAEYIEFDQASRMLTGALSGFDNEGGLTVHGIGFEVNGHGGMIGGFHAVPEPGTLAMLTIGGLALCGMLWKRRRKAA